MKKKCSVLPVLVAALMLFAATNASAACDPTPPAGWCFEHNGVRVEIVTASQDPTQFPQIVEGNSVFQYRVTNLSGKIPNFIDIFIPVCLEKPISSTGGSKYAFFDPGYGDPNTGFGLGQGKYGTFQWSYNGGSVGYISFTLGGKVFAYPNALFLNRGTGNYAWGQILSPACAQLPYHEFTQEVPYTVQKEVNIMGIDLCIESRDGSGCPTAVFSCSDSSSSICNCDEVNRTYWDKRSILDVGIQPGKLRQAWGEHDPRCPRTWWYNEGSCQYVVNALGTVFTYTGPTITGTVKDDNGVVVSGAWMKKCTGGSCTTSANSVSTNSSGKYSICVGAQSWSGTLQPKKTGLSFGIKNVSVSGADVVKNWP